MLAELVAAAAVVWPNHPDATEFARGQAMAPRQRTAAWRRTAGVETDTASRTLVSDLLRDHMVPLGEWSDGRRKVTVEWALRLTPEVTSRWIGWLSEREKWRSGEVPGRWNELRSRLAGRTVVVVALSAFPQRTLGGLGEENPAAQDETESVRFTWEDGMGRWPAQARRLAVRRETSPNPLDRFPWWQRSSDLQSLIGISDPTFGPGTVGMGSYKRVWWWVETPEPPHRGLLQLHVVSARKVRTAAWGVQVHPMPAPDETADGR